MANESRERLLAAAKQLFLARGYAGTTVDAICETAELTKGSFYHFFDTNPRMQQAVAAMFQAVTDDFAEKLQPIAALCPGKPAPTAAELADTLLGTLEGSIVLAKAHRDPTRIPKAIRGFRLSLAGLVVPV